MRPNFTSSQKKALFFDVNQTMVMRVSSFEESFKETWKDFTARLETDEEEDWSAEEVYRKYKTVWQARSKSKKPGLEKQDLQEKALKEAVSDKGLPIHKEFALHFFQLVKARQHHSKTLYPKVTETLAALAPHYTLAVISNSRREDVHNVMHKFGLIDYFPEERWFTATRLKEKKPNPYLFKEAMAALKLAPAQCAMIGNSYRHDVCGAWKAGIDAVWLHRSASKKNAPPVRSKKKLIVIKQFDQLLELFL